MFPPSSVRRSTFAIALAWLSAASAAAQSDTCGVQTAYMLGNATATSNIASIDTGWRLAPSTTALANGGGVPFVSRYSRAQVTTTAAFGRLHIQASGDARNWNGNGTSLWLLPFNIDPPTLRFRDTILVQSANLAVGTPVQLQVRARLAGFALVAGAVPSTAFDVQVRVASHPSNLTAATTVAALIDATGLATAIVNTTVGATLYTEGRLSVSVRDHAVENGPPASASYGVDLEALFDFTSATPDATLSFCSVANYPSLSATVTSIGTGCGAAPPTLTATSPRLGSTVTMTVTAAPPGSPVVAGIAVGAPLPLQVGPCTLWLDPATTASSFVGTTSAAGILSTTLIVPALGNLAGMHLTAQSVVLVNGGPLLGVAETTNALELVVGP